MNSISTFRCSVVNAISRSFSAMRLNSLTNKMLYIESVQRQQQQQQQQEQGQRKFCSLSNFTKSLKISTLNLSPVQFTIIPSCGAKYKGKLKKRCKDCYFARVDGQMMVNCLSYRRHKQFAKTVKKKYTWIITSCSQSKLRPY